MSSVSLGMETNLKAWSLSLTQSSPWYQETTWKVCAWICPNLSSFQEINLEPTSHCWWLAWFVFMWEDICVLYTPQSCWLCCYLLPPSVNSTLSSVKTCLCILNIPGPSLPHVLSFVFLIFKMLRILWSFETQCRFCLFQRICWFLINQKQGLYSLLIWNISCELCLQYLLYLISGSLWNCISLNFLSCVTPCTEYILN